MVLAFSSCTGQTTTVNDLCRRRRAGNKTLNLVVGRNSLLHDLADEIAKTSFVEKVIIEPECIYHENESWPSVSEPVWTSHGAKRLFEALGNLPMLTSIHLKDLGTFPTEGETIGIPLRLLTSLLANPNRSTQLKKLEIEKCRFVLPVQNSEVQEFAESVQHLTALEGLFWSERLAISAMEVRGHAAVSSQKTILASFFELPNLKSLNMEATVPYGMDPVPLGVIDTDVVGSCLVRETLTLRDFKLTHRAVALLTKSLRSANCPIKNLHLDLSHTKASDVTSLFESLRNNSSIETFTIGIAYKESWKKHQCLATLASALTDNTHVLNARLQASSSPPGNYRSFSEEDAQAFVNMLEHNSSITQLKLDDYNPLYDEKNQGELAPLIELYTNLNANGRKETLRQVCKNQWVEMLASSASSASSCGLLNLTAVHYWLKQNPTLFVC